jgi:tartrate dehydrogenase/decarboxylase / D-malate dehydrogenase
MMWASLTDPSPGPAAGHAAARDDVTRYRVALSVSDPLTGGGVADAAVDVLSAAAALGGFAVDVDRRAPGDAIGAPSAGPTRTPHAVLEIGSPGSLPEPAAADVVSLRPVRAMAGVRCRLPHRCASDIDAWFVVPAPGLPPAAGPVGTAPRSVGLEATRVACQLAAARPRHRLTVVVDRNQGSGVPASCMQVVREALHAGSEVVVEAYPIEAFVRAKLADPGSLDVVLTPAHYGSGLADLFAARSGTLGFAPTVRVATDAGRPLVVVAADGAEAQLFGPEFANPMSALWASAVVLDCLGQSAAGAGVMRALDAALRQAHLRPFDLGGRATTRELAGAVCNALIDRLSVLTLHRPAQKGAAPQAGPGGCAVPSSQPGGGGSAAAWRTNADPWRAVPV